jgi:hypothetical protein
MPANGISSRLTRRAIIFLQTFADIRQDEFGSN